MKYQSLQRDRLSELVNLWNQELGDDFPMREELFLQNSFVDKNVCHEGSRMVVDKDNRVIGFIIVKRWQEELDTGMSHKKAWIQTLLVDKEFHNQGIGKALLQHAESTLKTKDVTKILLGADPWHYFPGIPTQYQHTVKWFEKRGYKHQGTNFDLLCRYSGSDEPTWPKLNDVTFSILKPEEENQLLEFLERCFPGRWKYEAIHYFNRGGTGREFVVLKKNGKIIGFCRINDSKSPYIAQNVYWAPLFNDELGGIGPLGIDEQERNNGYGLAIVGAAVAFLRQRHIHSIVIDWTGLVDFYNRLGYMTWKRYESYRKEQ